MRLRNMRIGMSAACAAFCVAVAAGTATAAIPEVESKSTVTRVSRAVDVEAWNQQAPWWQVYNQSASAAYAKRDNKGRVRLEAMAQCHPGLSANKSAAKVTYKFTSQHSGVALIKPIATVYGTVITYGALVGTGGAEAKVTFSIHDDTADEDALEQTTVHRAESPGVVENLLKGKELEEKTESAGLGGYHSAVLTKGHSYTATIKLWAECWAQGGYTVRVDYSRHAPSLIGYILAEGVDVLPVVETVPQSGEPTGGWSKNASPN